MVELPGAVPRSPRCRVIDRSTRPRRLRLMAAAPTSSTWLSLSRSSRPPRTRARSMVSSARRQLRRTARLEHGPPSTSVPQGMPEAAPRAGSCTTSSWATMSTPSRRAPMAPGSGRTCVEPPTVRRWTPGDKNRSTPGNWSSRHRLAGPTSAIAFCVLLGAAALGVGNAAVFLGLAGFVAAQVLIARVLQHLGHRLRPDVGFRVVVVTWPIALGALGAAGWTAVNDYHGEVVSLIGLITAGFVALVEPTGFAIVWAVVAAAAVTTGAAVGGSVTGEALVSTGAIAVGAAFGERLRHVIEAFLGNRRELLEETARIPASRDPFQTAERLLQPLVRWTPVKNPSLVWFTPDGRSVFLAVAGNNLPPHLAAGRELP